MSTKRTVRRVRAVVKRVRKNVKRARVKKDSLTARLNRYHDELRAVEHQISELKLRVNLGASYKMKEHEHAEKETTEPEG